MGSATRRTHEIFGIVTLASALLIGPSVASVQFGSGLLMGPFGQTVGGVLNAALGITAYLIVIALLTTSLRIFAAAIGRHGLAEPTLALWRKRLGVLLGLGFGAILLHLIARPARLADASFGGFVGETLAEFLCAILSTAGTWIVAVAGFGLALILATDFSWVRAWLHLWLATEKRVEDAGGHLSKLALKERLTAASAWFGEQLRQVEQRRQPLVTDHSGAAVLPPVVRLDLADHLVEDDTSTSRRRRRRETPEEELDETSSPTPASNASPTTDDAPEVSRPDIEIDAAPLVIHSRTLDEVTAAHGKTQRSSPPPIPTSGSKPNETKSQDETKGQDTESQDAERGLAPIAVDCPATAPPTSKQVEDAAPLTIVQPTFRRQDEELEDAIDDKPVEDPNGQGFVLNGNIYRTPPLSILSIHGDDSIQVDEEEIQAQARRLTQALSDYKIYGKVTEVHPGPVVTMYEFVPAPGTRISRIASLSNDLAMSLHALRVRIVAPIPGRGAIGIEVPNKTRETVSFKEIVGADAFRKNKKAKLLLALGKTISGAPAVMDLAKMPHLLVAGATGSGKSVSINSMICSLLMRYSPEEVRMIMIDPKILELSGYNGIPHLLLPVVVDPKPAAVALRWAVNEMERRYQLLADKGVRDISGYNRKVDRQLAKIEADRQQELPLVPAGAIEEDTPDVIVRKSGDTIEVEEIAKTSSTPGSETSKEHEDSKGLERPDVVVPAEPKRRRAPKKSNDKPDEKLIRMPYLVMIIDEFADLMTVASKEVETSVARLAQKARACGIHLILATQRPSVDVITGLIKANFPSRVAFQVASNHDSKTILGSYGAENLLGAGDMLVLDRGSMMKRLHGAYVSDDEIEGIIDWAKEQGRPVYDMDILKAPEEEETGEGGRDDEPVDTLYDEAIAIVGESQQASISMIQRRLRIGYNRSARMVEQMEKEGIVGPPDGVRGRKVLIPPIPKD